ncbi:unnamed protein product [Cuscuta epithymum]|uniref:Large ribosomal subunit protein uL13c n=1 Tax=Cuscuta epithymum TaxID=186058 RepID=A0AAV0GIC6_9ASTE|nr:unnamed protein product [Cuscuta epithymum]
MAVLQCFTPSSTNPFSSSPKKALLTGFSIASSKPSVQLPSPLIRTHRTTNIRFQCQAALIPAEQQWMFDETGFKGPDVWNKTWYPKAIDHVNTEKPWYIVDAAEKKLGRLASTIANYIRGKNLATYTPSVDMGAFVVVVNAEKVAVTGKKRTQKIYRRHSGRPGGMKEETFDQLQKRIPERIIEHAVRGMLPKGRLGRHLFNHLKVYKGAEHPHQAQKPIDLPIRDKRINMLT